MEQAVTVGELMIELSRHSLRDQVLMRDEWEMLHTVARVTTDETGESVIVIVSAS